MEHLPEGFSEAYEAFRERFDWLARAAEQGDFSQAQLLHEQNLAFLDRWQGKIGVPRFEAAFVQFRKQIARLSVHLEAAYLEALAELLEQRHSALIHPFVFKGVVAHLKLMQDAPEVMRPELEKIFRDHMGYDFDAERYYRQSEGHQEQYDEEYRQLYSKMEVDWADHFDAATRERLARAPIEEINEWKTEVATRLETKTAQLARLDAENPVPEE